MLAPRPPPSMPSSLKNEITPCGFEGDGRDLRSRVKTRIVSTVHCLGLAMTLLALLAALGIVGLSAHTLAVYRSTHMPSGYLVPLWPSQFDVGPTTALVAGSAIASVANALSLLASKTPAVR